MAVALVSGAARASGIPREGGSSEGKVFRSGTPVIMDLDGGLIVGGGNALPGIDLQVTARLSTSARLYGGGEFGLFFFSGTGGSAVVIPILASISTEFAGSDKIHPMIGISLGPTLSTGSGFSTARLTFLINPGIRMDIGGATELNAQVRFGAMGSAFVVLPQFGISFAI